MQLVLRVLSKVNPDDAVRDAGLTKRGSIITALPDDHVFSLRERTNPEWRIIHLPLATEEGVADFLAPEDGDHETNPMLLRRKFSFDFEHPSLPPSFAAFIADDARAEPVFSLSFTNTMLNPLKKVNPTRFRE